MTRDKMTNNTLLLGVDTGGTFTDFVLITAHGIRVHKVLSTPKAPEQAILQGITELGLDASAAAGQLRVIHGSTVATNATLEGKGVATVFITNRGFKDMLTIARQTRRELYNLQPALVPPPVPANYCLEVDCRRDAQGNSVTPLSEESIAQLVADITALAPESVAINLLFSYLDSSDEDRLAAALPDSLFVSKSSFVLPEYKEYERGIATWLNAYLGPLMQRYLTRLVDAIAPSHLAVMQSSGGTINAAQASQRAVNLLLSGPAGGLAAAKFIRDNGVTDNLLTFDMGGTSTDVALVDGDLRTTNEGVIGPYPVAVPMVDMHTIGAGGGSIASVDLGGLLQVGPQSAGATPGPACYGKGGNQATVTDANVVLGRLRPDNFLGGQMVLDVAGAERAIDAIAKQLNLSREATALGIIQLANEHMARALQVISVQRGHDPQGFRLCCFGGAGGLHLCELAENLGMNKALVPRYGGVLSALGMLVAQRERQLSLTHQQPLAELSDEVMQTWLAQLAAEGRAELKQEGIVDALIQHQPSVDLRYLGQSYTLNIPYENLAQTLADFHRQHQQRYGHQLDRNVELVTLRQRVFCEAEKIHLPELPRRAAGAPLQHHDATLFAIGPIKVIQRDELTQGDELDGPVLICETVSTTLVLKNWRVRVDAVGHLLLEKQG